MTVEELLASRTNTSLPQRDPDGARYSVTKQFPTLGKRRDREQKEILRRAEAGCFEANTAALSRIKDMLDNSARPVDAELISGLIISLMAKLLANSFRFADGLSSAYCNSNMQDLRVVMESVFDRECRELRGDRLNLDGPKYKLADKIWRGWYEQALRQAGQPQHVITKVLQRFGDLAEKNEGDLRREVENA